jgi:hypothetical protein
MSCTEQTEAKFADDLTEFIRRCEHTLAVVFHAGPEANLGLELWVRRLVNNRSDAERLLHEEPLYFVGQFLGIDPLSLDDEKYDKPYADLVTAERWYTKEETADYSEPSIR